MFFVLKNRISANKRLPAGQVDPWTEEPNPKALDWDTMTLTG